jgi:hypothetical protein
MANESNLEKAYATIGALLAKGATRLTVEQVAAASGLARQSFYQQDDAWKEVRAVIKGKHSTRIKLVQVEIKQKTESVKSLEVLLKRVEEMEQEVERIGVIASTVYKELIDEVQRWFHIASESPRKKTQLREYINELNATRNDLQRVRVENELLKAERGLSNIVLPLILKKTVTLPMQGELGDIFDSFLQQYKTLLPTSHAVETLGAVYILCGLPYSGKTTWIKEHKPKSPGMYIYVNSCAHQAHIRRFIANQVQSSTNAEIHCVWVRTDVKICAERSAKANSGAANALKQQEIKTIQKAFQEPSLSEPFHSVILA